MSFNPVPPPGSVPEPSTGRQHPKAPQNIFQRIWRGLVAMIIAVWKFALPIFKLAKGGKILLTLATMGISVWFYSLRFGWEFAIGFVICIFIHEMGHVFAAWRLGMPVTSPIFIPGFGALILSRGLTGSAWHGAIMGYGGPLFGTLAALGCWGIYGMTGNDLFLGLAMIGFMMNLFNMIPIFPLDGGWITGAISPYIWVVGLVAMVGLVLFGGVHNPFIWILIIMSLPRIVTAFRTGTMDSAGTKTTPLQRTTMGIAYVSLCAFLVFGVASTNEATVVLSHQNQSPPIQ